MSAPLRMKVQRAAQPAGPSALVLPVAEVWVDSTIPNLIDSFSYLIPERLSERVAIGSRVQVPFRDKQLEGLVISRKELSNGSRELKAISKLLGDYPVANRQVIELIASACRTWGGSPYDLIRSAIPARVASIESKIEPSPILLNSTKSQPTKREYIHLPPKEDSISALLSIYRSEPKTGNYLILVPTARDLARLSARLIELNMSYISLDSGLPRADRYQNFLNSMRAENSLIIGMRSAIFAPIPNLVKILLHLESNENYYERRAPYWNTRDLALYRSEREGINLTMTGYLPSLDIALAIDQKEIKYRAKRDRIKLLAQPSQSGELLPPKIYQHIRRELKLGSILFLVPAKGYATVISCAKCRNIALCECGGKLVQNSSTAKPICTICAKSYQNWQCGWCQSKQIYLASRGIDRFTEEIGRSFPNFRIVQSTLENPILEIESERTIVIATSGMEPVAKLGYQCVVVLQVDRFLASSAIDAVERAYAAFFAASSLISETGSVALVCDDGTPITSALASWNPATIAKRELELCASLKLPPYSLATLIFGPVNELVRLKRALESALLQERAPSSLRIYGPSSLDTEKAKLTLLVDKIEQIKIVKLLNEVNRRRAIAKKPLYSVQVKPFSID